jgi:pyrroloquinoline quinone biosynthesis protein B
MKWIVRLLPFVLLLGCKSTSAIQQATSTGVSLVVLGTVQDGGSPHPGCQKDCCKELFAKPDPNRQVVSLGFIDNLYQKNFLVEATPDLPRQMKQLRQLSSFANKETPDGIFITHAHIGHYSGLMYLGREALNAQAVPVYTLPRLQQFLTNNGPWSQLVQLRNIALQPVQDTQTVTLTPALRIRPFTVPHRDEFSETVGFIISGPQKKALFIPDIDKWEKWGTSIADAIGQVDYALVDATFYDAAEINNRNMAEIPHPFVVESMALLKSLSAAEKSKVYFIHFNHTNPLLNANSQQAKTVLANGFNIATIHQVINL